MPMAAGCACQNYFENVSETILVRAIICYVPANKLITQFREVIPQDRKYGKGCCC